MESTVYALEKRRAEQREEQQERANERNTKKIEIKKAQIGKRKLIVEGFLEKLLYGVLKFRIMVHSQLSN
jgi:hypothetical protein